jgi:hypothetical protein
MFIFPFVLDCFAQPLRPSVPRHCKRQPEQHKKQQNPGKKPLAISENQKEDQAQGDAVVKGYARDKRGRHFYHFIWT